MAIFSTHQTDLFSLFNGNDDLKDASSEISARQNHTNVLVNLAASNIENRLFIDEHRDDNIIQFHPREEYLTTQSVGMISVDATVYRLLVGGLLLFAALRMLMVNREAAVIEQPQLGIALLLGAVLGFASGLTGIGGGVFLSPILLIFGWCSMRQSTAVAAGFILLNSIGGLAGYLVSDQAWPLGTGWLLLAAFIGCLAGAELASHRASSMTLQKLLALVLAIQFPMFLCIQWLSVLPIELFHVPF